MNYKRAVITEFGAPGVLKIITEESLPEPMPGEVRVKVLATCANFTDMMIRKGMYYALREKPPFSPGYDMVGVVDCLGEGVSGLKKGQRVAELTITGAYSEYMCIAEDRLVPVPDGVDPADAVSLVLSYVTAYQMLHRSAKVRPGQRILVHGAGGAVGQALLQLGKLLDLEMYGTASTGSHDLVSAAGAIPIDYRDEDFVERIRELSGEGVDAAFDAIGGQNFRRSFRALRKGGTLVAYGFYNAVMGKGGNIPLEYFRLMFRNVLPNGRSAVFYNIGSWRKKQASWFYDDLTELFSLLVQGKIKPLIGQRMRLEDAERAHELLEKGGIRGKIVLRVNQE